MPNYKLRIVSSESKKDPRLAIFLLFFFFFLSNFLFSQQLNFPLNYQINRKLSIDLNQTEAHTAFKPWRKAYVDKFVNSDSVLYRDLAKYRTWLGRKLFADDFLKVDSGNIYVAANPLFFLEYSIDKAENKSYFKNTRALEVKGNIGKKVSFYSAFYENQASFPDYIDSFVRSYLVVPGQGAPKHFKGDKHDFSRASGYVSYAPFDFLNLQLGHGKHFIGEGYRSLFLSDNAFNYPYLRINLNYKKFQYVLLFNEFNDFRDVYYNTHARKHGTFYLLSWQAASRLQISLFEGIIWKTSDELHTNKLSISYFNPIILFRGLQYGLNDENNVVLGFQAKYAPAKSVQLYGQFLLDNMGDSLVEKKYAFQLGAKYFNAFKLKNFYLQAEYNHVLPYTYAHNLPEQNYSHYLQALAHPLGANFSELVFCASYSYRGFFLDAKLTSATTGLNINDLQFGSDIFFPDKAVSVSDEFTGEVGQGLKTNIQNIEARLGYFINPRYNLQLFMGFNQRSFSNSEVNSTVQYFSFGLRTAINNYYYDF